MAIFGQVLAKKAKNDFFSKIRLEHFFTLSKPYLTAKFQKKLMNGYLDMSVTDAHTHNWNRNSIFIYTRLSKVKFKKKALEEHI